jgi:hypothetical protein
MPLYSQVAAGAGEALPPPAGLEDGGKVGVARVEDSEIAKTKT